MLDIAIFGLQNLAHAIEILLNIRIPLAFTSVGGNTDIYLRDVFGFIFLIFIFIKLYKVLTNESTIVNNKGGK